LVSLLTGSKSRYDKSCEYEIIRFCNKLNTTIVGGFSKLLKNFKYKYSNSIVSYANRRWSTGNLYKTNGFHKIRNSKPNYFYIVSGSLKSRIQYQKHNLPDKLLIFNPELSEADNMEENGFYRIFDSGNISYRL